MNTHVLSTGHYLRIEDLPMYYTPSAAACYTITSVNKWYSPRPAAVLVGVVAGSGTFLAVLLLLTLLHAGRDDATCEHCCCDCCVCLCGATILE
jgi:hypothetical protein